MGLHEARERLRAKQEEASWGEHERHTISKIVEEKAAKMGIPSIGTPRTRADVRVEPTATVPTPDGEPLLEDNLARLTGKKTLRESITTTQETVIRNPEANERRSTSEPSMEQPNPRIAPPLAPKPPWWASQGSPLKPSPVPEPLPEHPAEPLNKTVREQRTNEEPPILGRSLRKPERPALDTPHNINPEPLGTELLLPDNMTTPVKKTPHDPGTVKPSRDPDLIENNLSQMVESESNIKTVAKELFNKGNIDLKSEISHNEINNITRIRFLGVKFKLNNMDYLTENLLSLRVSKQRKSRQEFISALQNENKSATGGNLWQRMFGGNNRGYEPN